MGCRQSFVNEVFYTCTRPSCNPPVFTQVGFVVQKGGHGKVSKFGRKAESGRTGCSLVARGIDLKGEIG